jgi:hypothetical protein
MISILRKPRLCLKLADSILVYEKYCQKGFKYPKIALIFAFSDMHEEYKKIKV